MGKLNISRNLEDPFYTDELRVLPITHSGDKVFRVELYGCYLGKNVFLL